MTLFAVALSAGPLFAGGQVLWQDRGVQLCGPSADGAQLAATSDSAGGAIVVWNDSRGGGYYTHIYAQRVDAAGESQWTQEGVLVRDSVGVLGDLRAVDDGKNGAIVVWRDLGGSWMNDISAQRVSADGVPLWGRRGITVRGTNDDVEYWFGLARDGCGGVIVAFTVHPIATQGMDTLLVQRTDSGGNVVWETCIRTGTLDAPPFVCGDGRAGAVVAWQGREAGLFKVRTQRVDSIGAIQWDSTGVPVSILATTQASRACVSVGESCFVVGWTDYAAGTWQNRAQMIDLAGTLQWGPTGMPISCSLHVGSTDVGVPAGSARRSLWVWDENRTGTYDLFAQLLDSTGARCWDTAGVWVGATDTAQPRQLAATGDGRGGVISTWLVYRTPRNWDIYAQHVDVAGQLCWSDTGLAVCRDTDKQWWVPIAVTDDAGGAIIAWGDYRWGYGPGVYAQRVADVVGCGEQTEASLQRFYACPNPTKGSVVVRWPTGWGPNVAIFDASGRRVTTLLGSLSRGGDMRADWNGRDGQGRRVPPGVYVCTVADGTGAMSLKVVLAR